MINWRSFKAKKAKKVKCLQVQIRGCRLTGHLFRVESVILPQCIKGNLQCCQVCFVQEELPQSDLEEI